MTHYNETLQYDIPQGRGAGGAGGAGGAEGERADSLASPAAARTSFAALRCVFCQLPLSQADGTPKLMECLHSACEPCVKAKVDEKLAGSRDFLGTCFIFLNMFLTHYSLRVRQ